MAETRIFRATAEELAAADAWAVEICRCWDIPKRTVLGARVCISEIAANALEHGASASQVVELSVTLYRCDSGLDIEVTDSGRPFNPTAVTVPPPPRTIAEAEIGGLGIRLMRAYASEMSYRRDGGCNRLKLHLPAPSASKDRAIVEATLAEEGR
jgi:anti-sigma regulatory factor (Ser/Thr protein kinase)